MKFIQNSGKDVKLLFAKNNLFSFLDFSLLPLATGKIYPATSKIRQHNLAVAFEDYISTYSK